MKKMILVAALVFTTIFAVKADTIDFVKSNGDAYRIEVKKEPGRTTVSGSWIPRSQREREEMIRAIGKVVGWVLKAMITKQ